VTPRWWGDLRRKENGSPSDGTENVGQPSNRKAFRVATACIGESNYSGKIPPEGEFDCPPDAKPNPGGAWFFSLVPASHAKTILVQQNPPLTAPPIGCPNSVTTRSSHAFWNRTTLGLDNAVGWRFDRFDFVGTTGRSRSVTRRYPVDRAKMSERLRNRFTRGLRDPWSVALWSKPPGHRTLRFGNRRIELRHRTAAKFPRSTRALPQGPVAHCVAGGESHFAQPESRLRVSHHAGTYLCNAALFLSQALHQFSFECGTASAFVPHAAGHLASGRPAKIRIPRA